MNGHLLSLFKYAMFVVLNESLTSLRTLIDNKPIECMLDSGASHNFIALNWCYKQGKKVEDNDKFGVKLADGQEVPAISKVRCWVDLWSMKMALIFYLLDYNVPCVLGIPFFQTVNPTIDQATRSIQVCIVSRLSPLEVVR